ncbi:ORF6 [Xestia c-nigrum granulovirus]|uniref:ORF6 n=1 Tax=Xestia c-nigrum granulosis virus TaxID=51677 RepID=Q9PZ35_GVXN|nr:ORF6 [Xestia c-nigrum granulovirus]AAF05120.1 ORF6 [Xestia c-nigrum granulovirus]
MSFEGVSSVLTLYFLPNAFLLLSPDPSGRLGLRMLAISSNLELAVVTSFWTVCTAAV